MLTFYCYTWNKYLPPQKLVDGTCSYHSIRNANYMVNTLSQIKTYDSNYIKNIKNNSFFKKMISKDRLDKDLDFLIDDKINLSLNANQIKNVLSKKKFSNNIFPVYYDKCICEFAKKDLEKIKKITSQKSYVICFILFKKRLGVTHWCPITFDKRKNIVNVHITDSYDMFWWGDPRINTIMNIIYPGKKDIKCINDNIKGNIFYICKTTFNIVTYFFIIYIFIYALSLKLKESKK